MRVGDIIQVKPATYQRAANAYPYTFVLVGTEDLLVTRVTANTVIARGLVPGGRGQRVSIRVWHEDIVRCNGERTAHAGPVVRRIGVKPDDTPTMTYIGLDHPGIQWVWEDMAKFADEHGYCETYDELADEFGIPGRGEEFEINLTRNGINFTISIQGQDYQDAERRAELVLISE